MLISGGIYAFITFRFREFPEASGFFGHLLGVIGFLLMVMTEVLYSFRKRSRTARWGKMSDWLEFHIFTGLVGPFLVLLHSSWKFQGLAGAVMLMTLVIVISGFIGRYIYTEIPRNVDGLELESTLVEGILFQISQEIQALEIKEKNLVNQKRKKLLELEKVRIMRQVKSLGRTRRIMAIWHTLHIPLGMALFVAAFFHIGGAIYYATLLH